MSRNYAWTLDPKYGVFPVFFLFFSLFQEFLKDTPKPSLCLPVGAGIPKPSFFYAELVKIELVQQPKAAVGLGK